MTTRISVRRFWGSLSSVALLLGLAFATANAQQGIEVGTGGYPKLGLPDLTIPTTAAGYSWENVEWIYVQNQGNVAAPASTLGVTWNSGRYTKLFTFSVKSLAVGEGAWIKVELPWSYSQVATGVTMKYMADYYKAIWELNENNNDLVMVN